VQTNLLIALRGADPLHVRLHRSLRAAVLEGRLAPGVRLPATRQLARELGVSRMVVVQAYERLASEGYVEGRVGAGTFVPTTLRLPPREVSDSRVPGEPAELRLSAWGERARDRAPSGVVEGAARFDFRYGRADTGALPLAAWRRALRHAIAEAPRGYGDARGSARLRKAIAGYLARSRGVRTEPERIIVCAGSQQALDLTARVLLEPGDSVALEEPHYQGARSVLEAAGARLYPVATDDEGLVPESLPADLSVRLAVVTPSHQFPSGGVLPLGRRLQLLEWARDRNAAVLEDDYDGEFRYDAEPVEAAQALDVEQRVVYVGTFSKVLFPGLRVGYMVLPARLLDAFVNAKWLADRQSPLLEQEALATLIEQGEFERHLRRARARYARRRAALLHAISRHLVPRARVRVQGASAGLHVVLWFPGLPAECTPALIAASRRRDLGIYTVAPYFFTPPAEAGLILGYASLTEAEIDEGVRRLGTAFDEVT
jgi:GntR family transcriptional regulator / MocR family aminotransferase